MRLSKLAPCLALALLSTGCLSGGSQEPTAPPAETEAPPVVIEPSAAPEATAVEPTGDAGAPLSFEPATYADDARGFAFEHPASWSVIGAPEQQSRGEIVQLGEGEAVALSIAVLQWEPVADLEAYLAQRKLAWDASGMAVLSEDRASVDGVEVARFVVQGAEGDAGNFLFAALPDRYLALSGPDTALLQEVLGTLRFGPAGGMKPEPPDPAAAGPVDLDCRTDDSASLDWVACNVIAALETRNTQPLLGYMSDPFGMLYWRSEGLSATREDALAEIEGTRLPAAGAAPPRFSTDPATLPSMQDVDPAAWLGPEVTLELTLFSTGWGPEGEDEAMLFFTRDAEGAYRWSHLFYAMGGFER